MKARIPLPLHHRSLTHVMTESCHNDYSRIGSIGRLINYIQKTETSFVLQWRAAPVGETSSGGGQITKEAGTQIIHTRSSHHIIDAVFCVYYSTQ